MRRLSGIILCILILAKGAFAAGIPPLDGSGSGEDESETIGEPSIQQGAGAYTSGAVGKQPPADVSMTISKGERIEIADKGFSIVPPKGWEVYRDYAGATLLFQIPYKQNMRYQRTIQVLAFKGPKYIDQFTEEEFAKVIIDNFSKSSMSVNDYKLRNKLPVELADGTKGLLYYTEFKIDDVPLMQMHVLVSSATDHFLLTYTDLAKHFEQEDSPYLKEAYASMVSAELASQVPSRFQIPIALGIGLVLISLLVILWRLVSKGIASRAYKKMDSDVDGSGSDERWKKLEDRDELQVVEMEARIGAPSSDQEGQWELGAANDDGADDGFDDFDDDDRSERVG